LIPFNKKLYLPISLEGFWNLKGVQQFNDVVRIAPGIGYEFSPKLKAEFDASYHYTRDTVEDDFATNDFVFRFRVFHTLDLSSKRRKRSLENINTKVLHLQYGTAGSGERSEPTPAAEFSLKRPTHRLAPHCERSTGPSTVVRPGSGERSEPTPAAEFSLKRPAHRLAPHCERSTGPSTVVRPGSGERSEPTPAAVILSR
jgi:hypothetical protein